MIKKILAMPNDSIQKTIVVALALCFVCAIFVAGSAVLLKPLQEANKALDKKRNILKIAGLLVPDKSIDELFKQIEAKVVNLETGEYVDTLDPATYDQRKAAADPKQNISIPKKQDIASIKRRAKNATVYLVKDGEQLKSIIIPIHGYGLWSTLYGFLALEADAKTVVGLGFYQHAETPGLGGEVDNSEWRGKWVGKHVYDDKQSIIIDVMKGAAPSGSKHQVDGLSGATLTANGVENMLHYWLSEQGFAKYLQRIRGGSQPVKTTQATQRTQNQNPHYFQNKQQMGETL